MEIHADLRMDRDNCLRMDEDIKIIHKKLRKLEDEITKIENVGISKLTYKVETNKKIRNLEREVDKLKAAFDKLCCEKAAEEAQIQNQRNNRVEACVSQNVPKVFDPKRTMTVRKGEKWRYHNLNAWLEHKLRMKGQWTIKNLGHKVMHKQVEFFKIEYKHYILNKKGEWDKENIWIWEDLLASVDPKVKLIDYGTHQKKHGKCVVVCDDCLYVNGDKYVWDEGMERVILCNEAKEKYEDSPKIRCE